MDIKLLKLPIFSVIGAFIYHILNFLIVFLGYGINISPEIAKVLSFFPLILSIVIIFIIGLFLRKTYSKKDFFLSATLLVIYSIILLLFQRISFQFDLYNFSLDFILNMPIAIFAIFRYFAVIYNESATLSILFTVLSILEPYSLILFGKDLKD